MKLLITKHYWKKLPLFFPAKPLVQPELLWLEKESINSHDHKVSRNSEQFLWRDSWWIRYQGMQQRTTEYSN